MSSCTLYCDSHSITGVDEYAAITLGYSGGRLAQLSCSIGVDLVNDAIVYGSNGSLKLLHPFWCPTKLETPSVRHSTVHTCKFPWD